MKEIQMFPQITEETEENLLNIEEDPPLKSPSPPSSKSSSSVFESVAESPTTKNENHFSAPIPKIVAEDVEKPKLESHHSVEEEEFLPPPPRVRMRSLSGGAYRPSAGNTGRTRRQSGDDVLSALSPQRRAAAAILDAFRPRSKSDSKGKRPTFLSALKNSFFSNSQQHQRKNSQEQDSLEPLVAGDYRQRSRSGSDARGGGTMSKMIDMFRNRSNSISIDQRNKKPLTNSSGNVLRRRYSVDPDRRRHHSALGIQRSLELPSDHFFAAHHRSDPLQACDSVPVFLSKPVDESVFKDVISNHYFLNTKCYDILPVSGKVIILDINLGVEKAFHSLVSNSVRAAPLWSGEKMDFVGMFTISDFIDVLLSFYETDLPNVTELAGETINSWRKFLDKEDRLIYATPDTCILDTTNILLNNKVHRIPVYDEKTQSVLYILSCKRLLRAFCYQMLENHPMSSTIRSLPVFTKTLEETKIGTYENIATVRSTTPLKQVLRMFYERDISSIPVLDESGRLVDVYAKEDVLALVKDQSYLHSNMTLEDALAKISNDAGIFLACTRQDKIISVLYTMLCNEVNCMPVVDKEEMVVGMVSVSDLLKYFMPNKDEPSRCSSTNVPESSGTADCGTSSDDVQVPADLSSLAVGDDVFQDVSDHESTGVPSSQEDSATIHECPEPTSDDCASTNSESPNAEASTDP